MAEEAHDGDTAMRETTEPAAKDIESEIKGAMRTRVAHFKEQADSLTFEGVRRLLEKDLGLEKYALDVHKRFIKQCLSECLDDAADDKDSKHSEETLENDISSNMGEATDASNGCPGKKNKESSSEDEDKREGSPVLGLLSGHKTSKYESVETEGSKDKEVLSKGTIKKAIKSRASYFRANSEKITMAGVRRLLEEDLELDKYALDSYKTFIREQLDEALESPQVSKSVSNAEKKSLKKNTSKKADIEESSNTSDGESEDVDDIEEELKPRKRVASKGKPQNSKGVKKRKINAMETKAASKKRTKPADTLSEDKSDAEEDGNVSGEDHSQSSAEKAVKRKEVSTPAYGKRVEQLKSVIKSCALSIPPAIYKRVNQVPENKREASLIKELEQILSKEGLSPNPTEKEIKDVRKKKERAKELEGIDMSNIVTSSRRRSAASFVPPPRPKIEVKSDKDDDNEDEDEDSDGNDDSDEENEDSDENVGNESDDADEGSDDD